ncbi:hypothetical protein PtA15_2A111 [Puccinia triticina]|uniref:Uncharacterized protein n=1 Tax=Puccinia triticina TaxID=208348 RepID=A0ABY7C9V0_9BASI|nr:uncharacterized protein PtA15_2A111 [Puccinia triticina]WAQ81799.1 hypothetical protein PtA15_2A111 [Puccinia triticina]
MAPQLREKSKATPAKPESSKTDDERELFVEIHSQHVKPDDLWKSLLDTAGLEKVHEHTDQLASVFDFVNLATARRAIVALLWSYFTAGETGSWKLLQKELGINEKDHVDRTETLIRRAYFVRFPERDASVLTDQEMLVALGFPSAAKQIVATPQINWSTEIVQQGFDAEYQGHDLIKSTGQPPRSDLATHFTPVKPIPNMIQHYSYLIIAILKAVYDFFKRPDIRTKSLEEQLSEWFDYSFQMNNIPKDKFNAKVEYELNNLKMKTSSESNLTWEDIQIDLDRQPAVKEIQPVQKWACEPVGRKWVIDFVVMATPEDLKANACQCWEWPIDTCPKVNIQTIARVRRIGQTQKVTVYHLICAESVEQQMIGRLRKKLYLLLKILDFKGTNPDNSLTTSNDTNDEETTVKTSVSTADLCAILRGGASSLHKHWRQANDLDATT